MIAIENTLIKYIQGDVSPAEKKEIILWLEENPEHVKEYLALRKLHDLDIWAMEELPLVSGSKKHFSIRKISVELLKIASVLFIGIAATLLWMYMNDSEVQLQTIYVPAGQRTELFLNDGTQVWLNSGTTFTFPDHFTKRSREVKLNGEAYLHVAKNEKAPFIVNTGKYSVKVLGTEFNLKSYSQNDVFETALIEGSVEVVIPDYSYNILLKPDEQITKVENGFKKSKINDLNYFKWREGLLCFENEKVSSLFAKLELYYDIRIKVINESLLDYTYSGKFRIRDGVEHVLKVLQVKHKFKYTRNDEKNMITIE